VDVTQFDLIAITLILVSAGVGFARGGAREMVSVLSFLIAAVVALLALRFTGPPARALMEPDWAGTVLALLIVFVAVYAAVRLTGGGIARRIQNTQVLGLFDRAVGAGFGLIRALVVLGAFNLMFNAATPENLAPEWVTKAASYPLTSASAQVLKAFAPTGMEVADKIKPRIEDAVRQGTDDSKARSGYDARARGDIDDLVERSR
jgi:membrane protein required for colicin V production